MRQLALAPVKPLPRVETAQGGPATAHVVERPVKNDVLSPRWFGYARGKAHAYLIPQGETPTGAPVCGKKLDASRLADGSKNDRCRSCAAAVKEDTRKRSTGLAEPTVENVATGAQHGDPRDAERRRVAELAQVRDGEAPVPTAHQAPIGQRDHGMSDGVAMVRGRNMAPVQPQRGWAAAAGTMYGPIGRERPDREVVGDGKPSARRSNASKRRYRKQQTTARQVAARLARQGNKD